MLAEVCENLAVPEVVFSLAVAGTGKSLYQAALAAGPEGVMAKQLASVYLPGKRSIAWKKIKPQTWSEMDTSVQR